MILERRAGSNSPKRFPWIRNKWRAARNIAFLYGPDRRFKKFEASFHPQTWSRHDELLAWAESRVAEQSLHEVPERYEESRDPVVRQGYALIEQLKRDFKGRCHDCHELRILVHLPPASASSAYASLCASFVQSFQFLGLAARGLEWSDDTHQVLESFQPTLLMTVDHHGHLNQIDWRAVQDYRRTHHLRIALNASLQEYGNTSLVERLEWAKRHNIDFYYSFKNPNYIETRYRALLDRGYQVFSLEFGANPLVYYPVPGIDRDLNYVFLGSTNPDKWQRYYSYPGPLWRKHAGYIDGPWWHSISRFGGAETHRYLCARAKVGLNLHIKNQIEWAGELNERTYNLAACGVPQLIDAPKLLFERFQPDSFFVARRPSEYQGLFAEILRNPAEAQRRALQAQREVFAELTVFHRTEQFVAQVMKSGLYDTHNSTSAQKQPLSITAGPSVAAKIHCPLVSVVMPAFNAEQYVGEAIESILCQTLSDFEFIIIDDGSTDNTEKVLTEYETRDTRIQVLRQRNSGVAASMNLGCSLTKGKYIARMDADDLSHPRRLSRQVEFLEKHPDIGLCGTWMHSFQGTEKTLNRYPSDPDIAKSMLPFQLPVDGGSIMLARQTYLQSGVVNNPDVGATDDYLFVVECSKYFRFASVPEPLYFYRIHPAQVTRREGDRQNKFARQIRLMQLEELGLKPTKAELDIHEAISEWRLAGDKDVIQAAEDWLMKLKRANALQAQYPEAAFSQVLGSYWLGLCMRHARLGFWTYQRFSESHLTQGAQVGLGQRLKLLAKCVTGYDRVNSHAVPNLRTGCD